MRFNLLFWIILLLFMSCKPLMLQEMQTSNEPEVATLKALNFKKPRTVILEWPEDIGAEEYLLYRDIMPDMRGPTLIYQGSALSFEDTFLDADNIVFYYYQLAKRRGTKVYPLSMVVMGISADTVEDVYERNNTKAEAKAFTTNSLTANIFLFKDIYNTPEVEDVDHYYIDIKPMYSVTLTLSINTDAGNLESEDLYFAQEGGPPQVMLAQNGTNVTISNTQFTTQRIYFSIYVNRLKFIDSAINGGKFGFYRIDIMREEPYQPK